MKGIESDPSLAGLRGEGALGIPSRKTDKKREKSSLPFLSLFRTQEKEEVISSQPDDMMDELAQVMDQIHSLGEEMARHPSNQNIQAYKRKLKLMVQTFVDRGLTLERQVSTRNILQQKSYQIIKVIDEKLERLVVGILQSQLSQLDILARVEEIQGLLVNLLY